MKRKPGKWLHEGPGVQAHFKFLQQVGANPVGQTWGTLSVDLDQVRELMAEDDLLETALSLELLPPLSLSPQ